MGAHVFRQVAGLGAGLPAEGALKDELAPRPIPLPHARPIRVHSLSFTKRRIPCPLVSHHRSDHRRILLGGTGQTVGQPHFSDLSGPSSLPVEKKYGSLLRILSTLRWRAKRDPKAKMLYLQSFLRKSVSLGYVGRIKTSRT